MTERAKIFTYGGSQAVRLPKAVRFPEALREVVVWREGRRVILEAADEWTNDFIETLSSWNEDIERPAKRAISRRKDPIRRVPMKSLFDPSDRESIRRRLETLEAASPRQWGKMNAAQMVTHCARALETGSGDRPMKQAFLGRILTPFIRSSALGEKPFGRSSPTDPSFIVSDARDFVAERQRLLDLIDHFVERGTDAAGKETHAFFGRLNGQEWGELMYKHIDHHLQQFGV